MNDFIKISIDIRTIVGNFIKSKEDCFSWSEGSYLKVRDYSSGIHFGLRLKD